MSISMALRLANRDDLNPKQTALLCAAEEYGGYRRVMLVADSHIREHVLTAFSNCAMPVEPLIIKIGRCEGYSIYDPPPRAFNDTSRGGARRAQRNQNKVWRK